MTDITVSAEWLQENINAPDLVVIDASWYLPAMGRDAKAEYAEGHIPGAIFFDIDHHSDRESGLPHTLPSAEQFAKEMGALGISETSKIVVYDGIGLFSAARVWWMFKLFGADDVYVLDGGMAAWKAAGGALTSDVSEHPAATFNAKQPDSRVAFLDDVKASLNGETKILDARGKGRFTAEDPEPRAGMRGGHMPGAQNLPYGSLQDGQGRLLPAEQLQSIFDGLDIQKDDTIITTCGSGVTAAIITMGLTRIGYENTRLYDGSWSEWGSRQDTPIDQGE